MRVETAQGFCISPQEAPFGVVTSDIQPRLHHSLKLSLYSFCEGISASVEGYIYPKFYPLKLDIRLSTFTNRAIERWYDKTQKWQALELYSHGHLVGVVPAQANTSETFQILIPTEYNYKNRITATCRAVALLAAIDKEIKEAEKIAHHANITSISSSALVASETR